MPKPIITSCGGEGQPPCPPQPASETKLGSGANTGWYSRAEVLTYGAQCFEAGKNYQQTYVDDEDAPQPATGAGEEQA